MFDKKTGVLAGILILLLIIWAFLALGNSGVKLVMAETNSALDQILAGMEKRYTNSALAAEFFQESTIKSMEISDIASGKVYVRHPGMMRWEYQKPDRQIIITDGFKLWIYRPEDNQVMTGDAPEFFRDGRGASFLSDITLIRKKFTISLLASEDDSFHELLLVSDEKTLDVAEIRLAVAKDTFVVTRVVTKNFYGDETRIEFLNTKFNMDLADDVFSFKIPEGADVLKLAE